MKMKKVHLDWLSIIWRVAPAIKAGIKAGNDAVQADSPGGKKVTREEAGAIAMSILQCAIEPLTAEILRQTSED